MWSDFLRLREAKANDVSCSGQVETKLTAGSPRATRHELHVPTRGNETVGHDSILSPLRAFHRLEKMRNKPG